MSGSRLLTRDWETSLVVKKSVSLIVTSPDSLALSIPNGSLSYHHPEMEYHPEISDCFADVNEGDCVRMEVAMDSIPRTVQFFLNGERGKSFVSGLPSSVGIGFSVSGPGSSFRIDRITQLLCPTEIDEDMEKIKWDIEPTPWPYY
ncbi:hypothetical protein BLNAU_23125 [Blattamonas nauphoetae]|uniref:SPRY domain-containing protein n=1 Tax=Blattamonas nauphoetae TaxID=2049346 RepID=A0ABQ9WR49_9EUKA|nr:hypothetical protein BLNAU_23125 [Blattamonas nauphoetae]